MKWNVNGRPFDLLAGEEVNIDKLPDRLMVHSQGGVHSAVSVKSGGKILISYRGQAYSLEQTTMTRPTNEASNGHFSAPMPGVVIEILTEVAAAVVKGQKLMVLEAMKTQQPVVAPFDGTIQSLSVRRGEQVIEGQPLVVVVPHD